MQEAAQDQQNSLMTFGGHLEALRTTLYRILVVVVGVAAVVFAFKEHTFKILLGPSKSDFCTYRWVEALARPFNPGFRFEDFHVDLIATNLSSQFMAHLTSALCLGLFCASPFVVYELFKFVSPALYEHERKYSKKIIAAVYLLFVAGVAMSYFILFPISFRFLGTYSVADQIRSTITLDSYISTFLTLAIATGLMFQLPVIAYMLRKFGLISVGLMEEYRKYAFLLLMLVAAIITPPDIMSMLLVGVPMYLLYELSIRVVKRTSPWNNG